MSTAKILPFRRPTVPTHGVIVILEDAKHDAVQTTIQELHMAGDEQSDIRMDECGVGPLEHIAIAEKIPKAYSLIIPPEFSVPRVLQSVAKIPNARTYPFDQLRFKIAIHLHDEIGSGPLPEISGNHLQHTGRASDIIALYDKYRTDGAHRVLIDCLRGSTPLATRVCGKGNDAVPVFVSFGIEVFYDPYVIEAVWQEGPFACSYWGEQYVVVPHKIQYSANRF